MPEVLELFLLNSGGNAHAVALGRSNGNVVIENLPLDQELTELGLYRQVIEGVVLGTQPRPTSRELRDYGEKLFKWLFRGELKSLYQAVPSGGVSLQILSDRPELRVPPWEFMHPPAFPAPHRERCVVRVLPTCGAGVPPGKLRSAIRVLFVSADPIDQTDVPWEAVQKSIERAYTAQFSDQISIKVIEGATRAKLSQAIRDESFDVFHFFGHGMLRSGDGHLVLVDSKSKKSDLISGYQLANLLSGKKIRLAILSSCLSSAGNPADDFSAVATGLLRTGIPAVLANQVSIPTKSVALFVGSVYRKLLETGNIDEAVMEGRVQLSVDLEGTTGKDAVIEWGIPSLYRLSDSARLFV